MSKKKMQEMGMTAKGLWTAALGVACALSLVVLIVDPLSGCNVEDKFIYKFGDTSVESTYRYFDYLYALQWFALGCLVFILWLWREKLGIDGLGPVHGSSGPEITTDLKSVPIDGANIPSPASNGKALFINLTKGDAKVSVSNKQESNNLKEDSSDTNKSVGIKEDSLPSIETTFEPSQVSKEQSKDLDYIYNYVASVFERYKKISVEDLARIVGISPHSVYKLLRSKRNLYRLDGNGIKSVVTKYNSYENIVLDKIYEELNAHDSVRQYREAAVGGFSVDAIFRSATDIYVVSLKSVRVSENKNTVGKEVSLLNKVSMKFKGVNRHLMVVFVGPIDEQTKLRRMETLQKHCSNFSNFEMRFINPEAIDYTSRSAE